MDVSNAVDVLFGCVVPERLQEIKVGWSASDRVRLLSVSRFLLQENYGNIQVSEKALRLIWLIGFTTWAAIEDYNIRIVYQRLADSPYDPMAWHSFSDQRLLDQNFDRLLGKVRELENCSALEDFVWPEDVPEPIEGLHIADQSKKATFDLVCMAGAFVFAHELRHAMLGVEGIRPDRMIDEERECDRWALSLLLNQASSYASDTNQDSVLVCAKRLLGVWVAQVTILILTKREYWGESESYPSISDRLRAVLDAVVGPVPDWFWVFIVSTLTALARAFGVLPPSMAFPATDRELAYVLCDTFLAA